MLHFKKLALSLILIQFAFSASHIEKLVIGTWEPVTISSDLKGSAGELSFSGNTLISRVGDKTLRYSYTISNGVLHIEGMGSFPVRAVNENMIKVVFEERFNSGATTVYKRKGTGLPFYNHREELVGTWVSSRDTISFDGEGRSSIDKKRNIPYNQLTDKLIQFNFANGVLPVTSSYYLNKDTLVIEYGAKGVLYLKEKRVYPVERTATVVASDTKKKVLTSSQKKPTFKIESEDKSPEKKNKSPKTTENKSAKIVWNGEVPLKKVPAMIRDMEYHIDDGSYAGFITFDCDKSSDNHGNFIEVLKSHKTGKKVLVEGKYQFSPENLSIQLNTKHGKPIIWYVKDAKTSGGKSLVVADSEGSKTILSRGAGIDDW